MRAPGISALATAFLGLVGCAFIGGDPLDHAVDPTPEPGQPDADPGGGGPDAGEADAGVPGVPPVPEPALVDTDDFEDGDDDDWTRYGGGFDLTGGVYRLENLDTFGKSRWLDRPDDVTIEVDVRFDDGEGDAGVIVRGTAFGGGIDEVDGYYAALNVGGDLAFFGRMDGGYVHLAGAPVTLDPGVWYHVKVVAAGDTISLFVGDMQTPKVSIVDDTFAAGAVGLRAFLAVASFDNISATK